MLMPAADPPAALGAPTSAQVAAIEAAYAPPSLGGRTASPLDGYARSYWRDPGDADVIVGQYLSPVMAHAPPGVRLFAAARTPVFVFDGGCGVVNLRFRLSTASLEARCGGR